MLLSMGREIDTMLYNVAQLMKACVGTTLEYPLHEEDVQLDEGLKVVGPLDGDVLFRCSKQGLLIGGRVHVVLEPSCDRCLTTFEQPMHVTFIEQFYPTVDV